MDTCAWSTLVCFLDILIFDFEQSVRPLHLSQLILNLINTFVCHYSSTCILCSLGCYLKLLFKLCLKITDLLVFKVQLSLDLLIDLLNFGFHLGQLSLSLNFLLIDLIFFSCNNFLFFYKLVSGLFRLLFFFLHLSNLIKRCLKIVDSTHQINFFFVELFISINNSLVIT